MPELPPPPQQPQSPAARLSGWAARWWGGLAAVRRWQLIAAALVTVVAALAAGIAWQGASRALPELDLPAASEAPVAPAGREPLFVHGAGALVRPGLYRLPAGARVADLVEAAGGPTPDADVHQLNLAARLNDGDRVYVPRLGELPAAGGEVGASDPLTGSAGGKLDLNSATQAQLEDLPGVGPATAAAIVDERKRRGRFKSVEELLDVRGIGPAKLDQIRELVRV